MGESNGSRTGSGATPAVTVVGSVNLDLVASVEHLPEPGQTLSAHSYARIPGGKGANQALAAARQGAAVTMVAAVGRDSAADEALALLADGGVDLSRLRRTTEPTGVALITVDDEGENTIVVVPGANATLSVDPADTEGADAVICQLEIPDSAVAAAAASATGFFCLNVAPARPVDVAILRRCDLVVANRGEYDAVPGCDEAKLVAITEGPAGASLWRDGVRIASAEPPKVDAVDGTGAGDSFVGALVVGLVSGLDPEVALRRACAAGAVAASRPGAQTSLPTVEDVDALLASQLS